MPDLLLFLAKLWFLKMVLCFSMINMCFFMLFSFNDVLM